MKRTSEEKSFTIVIQELGGAMLTSLVPGSPDVSAENVFEGLLGGLAAVYVSTWGVEDEMDADPMSHEDFARLVAAKLLARLSAYTVDSGTLQ